MSNDRVYLRCKVCGENKLLFKYNPVESSLWRPAAIQDWINLHIAACHNAPPDLGDDPRFELVTELTVALHVAFTESETAWQSRPLDTSGGGSPFVKLSDD